MNYIISLAIVYVITQWPVWLQFIFSLIFAIAISFFFSSRKEKHHQQKTLRKLVKRFCKDKTNQKKR